MKKNTTKKSKKIAEKKAARKPRLTKEEREAHKLKLQEERAAKKAASLAKREAKKQKEADRKAALKLKREERKAKKMARLQKQKEREAALKLKAKERAEAKKAREAARAEKKAARLAKKTEKKPCAKKVDAVKKVSAEEKLEYERNEWKALSAIRRYVKDEAKTLAMLEGDKLGRKLKKLEKMGYAVELNNGCPTSIGYSFKVEVKGAAIPLVEAGEPKPKKVQKTKQPQVFEKPTPEPIVEEAEPTVEELAKDEHDETVELLSDEEILKIADAEKAESVDTVLIGDAFKDETEIAEDAESLENDDLDGREDLDDFDDDDSEDDDSFGEGSNISKEQEAYRHEFFNNGEANGDWD